MSICILHITKNGIEVISTAVSTHNVKEHQRVLSEIGYTSYTTKEDVSLQTSVYHI